MPPTGLDPVRPDRVYEDSGICEPAFTNRKVGVRGEVVVSNRSTSSKREEVGEAAPVGVREDRRTLGPDV